MKRWLSRLFIAGYVSILGYGLVCHSLRYRTSEHVGMYFIVWDMYSGWCGYEERHHLLAEGESGAYYALNPAPWGELVPFGSAGRIHYDVNALFVNRVATNVLRHTEHEPIRQILLVDESWSKRFNLDDRLWTLRYDEPKQPRRYYYLRAVYDADGNALARHCDWRTNLALRGIADNPRLQAEIARDQPYATIDTLTGSAERVMPAAYFLRPQSSR